MRYSPKPKNKICEVASITLLICAAVMFFFAAQSYVKGAAAVQLLGVCTLTAGAYFLIRRLTSFIYIILPQSEDIDENRTEALLPSELSFIVAKKRGKSKEVYQCRLDLGSLKSVSLLPDEREKRKAAIRENGPMSAYKYTATIGKCDTYLLVFSKPGYDRVGLIIEPDREMAGYLKSVVEINKSTDND